METLRLREVNGGGENIFQWKVLSCRVKWVLFPTGTIFPSGCGQGIVSTGNYAHFTRLESVSKATDYYLGQRLDHPAMPRQADLEATGSTCNSLVFNIPPPVIPLHAMPPAPPASLRINNSDMQVSYPSAIFLCDQIQFYVIFLGLFKVIL